MPTDGGEPTEIVRETIGLLGFGISPDGTRLALVPVGTSMAESGVPLVVCELPACGNRRDLLLPADAELPIRWTPDGEEIAYLYEGNIWSMALDTAQTRQITHFPGEAAAGFITDFAWSHDGQRLAIARSTSTSDVVLFRLQR